MKKQLKQTNLPVCEYVATLEDGAAEGSPRSSWILLDSSSTSTRVSWMAGSYADSFCNPANQPDSGAS